MTVFCTVDAACALIGISELRDGDSPTTPTLSQARAFVEAISAEIIVHLATRSVAPEHVTPEYLRSISSVGVAARIAKARWPSASGPGSDAGAAGMLEGQYSAALAFIDNGGLDSYATSDALGDSPAIGHGFADHDGVPYVPQFTRAMEW